MLTNEQRAHDLAILVLDFKLKPENAFLSFEAKDSNVEVNIVDEYFEVYNFALSAINKKMG